jgi:cell division septation protein DedD
VSDSAPPRCPHCNATVDANQEYCLECGTRLDHEHPGAIERTSAGIGQRHGWAGPWILPAFLGLVVAALGTGAAIAISGDGAQPSAVSTATGGSLTVTNDGSTLTAPEPTEPATTTKPSTTTAPKPATTPKPPVNPASIVWPRGRRGWTIVLISLPQANGLAAANAKATQARRAGLRRVGVLDSARYASLHPGYYVVFTGVFDSEAEASSALQRARAAFPAAYQREIIP